MTSPPRSDRSNDGTLTTVDFGLRRKVRRSDLARYLDSLPASSPRQKRTR